MASCQTSLNGIPILTGCPPDEAYFLLFNVESSQSKMAFIPVSTYRECLIGQIFGTGALEITGSQLDSEGIYLNSDLIDNLLVFACNIPNFLEEGTQFNYVLNGDNQVVGVQILIGYDPSDRFIIIPNPIL